MNAANQRRMTPVLASILLLLGAGLVLLHAGVGRKLHWLAPRALAPLPPAVERANLPAAVPLAQFALVWQKPLFSPDRKPVARAAAGDGNLGDLELTGIILTPDLHMVLLRDKHAGRQLRLREGESLPDGSVTLVEVRQRSALFDAAGGRTEMKLPAGAPIDAPKAGAPGTPANPPPGDAMMRVSPAGRGAMMPAPSAPGARPGQFPTRGNIPASFLERLKANNERRRAARAAATHQGVP